MKIDGSLLDTEILKEIGLRIKACRIRKECTQAELAEKAGVSKGTVSNAEKGESIQMGSFLRILRELDCVDSLDVLLPEAELSPMQLIQSKNEKIRQRFRNRKKVEESFTQGWKWGDMNED